MATVTLGVEIEVNIIDNPVGFKISFDDDVLFNALLTTHKQLIEVDMPDDIVNKKNHYLNLELFGKEDNHTILDENGNIIQSSMIKIINLYFDDMLFIYDGGMACSLWDSIKYHHNNNGHSDDVVESVSILMGMNGKLVIPLYTPLYIWMLENSHEAKSVSSIGG